MDKKVVAKLLLVLAQARADLVTRTASLKDAEKKLAATSEASMVAIAKEAKKLKADEVTALEPQIRDALVAIYDGMDKHPIPGGNIQVGFETAVEVDPLKAMEWAKVNAQFLFAFDFEQYKILLAESRTKGKMLDAPGIVTTKEVRKGTIDTKLDAYLAEDKTIELILLLLLEDAPKDMPAAPVIEEPSWDTTEIPLVPSDSSVPF